MSIWNNVSVKMEKQFSFIASSLQLSNTYGAKKKGDVLTTVVWLWASETLVAQEISLNVVLWKTLMYIFTHTHQINYPQIILRHYTVISIYPKQLNIKNFLWISFDPCHRLRPELYRRFQNSSKNSKMFKNVCSIMSVKL